MFVNPLGPTTRKLTSPTAALSVCQTNDGYAGSVPVPPPSPKKGFEAYLELTPEQIEQTDRERKQGIERSLAILAEREKVFNQQQADFRARWNSYNQALQEQIQAPPEETQLPPTQEV